jgi:hypothetical protein
MGFLNDLDRAAEPILNAIGLNKRSRGGREASDFYTRLTEARKADEEEKRLAEIARVEAKRKEDAEKAARKANEAAAEAARVKARQDLKRKRAQNGKRYNRIIEDIDLKATMTDVARVLGMRPGAVKHTAGELKVDLFREQWEFDDTLVVPVGQPDVGDMVGETLVTHRSVNRFYHVGYRLVLPRGDQGTVYFAGIIEDLLNESGDAAVFGAGCARYNPQPAWGIPRQGQYHQGPPPNPAPLPAKNAKEALAQCARIVFNGKKLPVPTLKGEADIKKAKQLIEDDLYNLLR